MRGNAERARLARRRAAALARRAQRSCIGALCAVRGAHVRAGRGHGPGQRRGNRHGRRDAAL